MSAPKWQGQEAVRLRIERDALRRDLLKATRHIANLLIGSDQKEIDDHPFAREAVRFCERVTKKHGGKPWNEL